jgi:pimeloyl-ACP methyl ester carboxylesterase
LKVRKVLKYIPWVALAALIVFFYGVVPYFLTGIATTSRFHFHDPNDAKTPQSFGLDFHDVEFNSADGIRLRGWYVPASGVAKGTIIYCHGHNRSRVEMLPEAAFAHGLGYNGLLFDLRHQGHSDGTITSVGYWERLDAEAATRYALAAENAAPPVLLWGISMGAAAALMAAAESPDVAAVISDSTFLNYSDMIKHHFYLFRGIIRRRWWWFPPLPAFPLANEVLYWSAWRAHFSPSDFDLQKAVARIGSRPILFVAVQDDPRMPPAIARALYAVAASPEKQIVVLPGNRHGEGFKLDTRQYEQAVTSFLSRVRPGGPVTEGKDLRGPARDARSARALP